MPYHKAKPAHGSRWGKVRTRCSCCISLAVSLQVFHSHTCPLPVLLCFFHRLLRAVRHYWDAFQPEDPGRFVLSDGNAGLQQGNPWLTHLAPDKLLPFLYKIPCEGSNCVKRSWYTTLKINNKHQIKVSAHFVFFPVCKIHCFTGFDWEKKNLQNLKCWVLLGCLQGNRLSKIPSLNLQREKDKRLSQICSPNINGWSSDTIANSRNFVYFRACHVSIS